MLHSLEHKKTFRASADPHKLLGSLSTTCVCGVYPLLGWHAHPAWGWGKCQASPLPQPMLDRWAGWVSERLDPAELPDKHTLVLLAWGRDGVATSSSWTLALTHPVPAHRTLLGAWGRVTAVVGWPWGEGIRQGPGHQRVGRQNHSRTESPSFQCMCHWSVGSHL